MIDFDGIKVLVVGDIMVDEYIYGIVDRISPEAPVPVVDVKKKVRTFGGSANVVHNLYSLGAYPILCGVIGNDNYGQNFLYSLEMMELPIDCVKIATDRPTTVKNRIVGNNNQHIVRIDTESKREISNSIVKDILECSKKFDYDGIIISDYGKGVVGDKLIRNLSSNFIFIDPKDSKYDLYKGATLLTPNKKEAEKYCGFEINEKSIVRAGWYMIETLHLDYIVITLGRDGMVLFDSFNSKYLHIKSKAKEVFDVTGAGDTVISVISLGLMSGMNIYDSVEIANTSAGMVIGEVGTTVVNRKKLKG